MKTSRRNFLKMTVGATAIAVTGAVNTKEADAAVDRTFSPDAVSMFYDSTKCIGCQSCVTECYKINFAQRANYVGNVIKFEDQSFIMKEDLIPKLAPQDEFNNEKPWLNVVTNDYRFRNVIQKYVDQDEKVHLIKHQCMH